MAQDAEQPEDGGEEKTQKVSSEHSLLNQLMKNLQLNEKMKMNNNTELQISPKVAADVEEDHLDNVVEYYLMFPDKEIAVKIAEPLSKSALCLECSVVTEQKTC